MNTPNSSSTGIGKKKFIPGVAWFFLVLILICLPGSELPSVDDWFSKINFDKWIHIGLFAVLAFLFMLPFLKSALPIKQKWYYVIRITIATVLWGLTTEYIQRFFVSGRSFDLYDWAADSFGALLAMLYARIRFIK